MQTNFKHSIVAFGLAAASLAAPIQALAQDSQSAAAQRRSPLADAPAIRKRVELRDKRFELGVGGGSTIGQDFYHAVLVGARLGYHLNDWFAIGATAAFNVTPNLKTSFHDKLEGTLNTSAGAKPTDRTPTYAEAVAGMNKIGQVFGVQAEIIPFTGKYALFSKLFWNYDFYAFGGPGFINFTADRTTCSAVPGQAGSASPSCPVIGLKTGFNFGFGMHTYFNDLVALNVELRDVMLWNNPAGRDETGDRISNNEDNALRSNFFITANIMFFLPSKAPIRD